jgi:heme-degrading monooxygenase HmoA
VILVVFRHPIEPGTEDALVRSWQQCKTKMLGQVKGLLEASIYRNEAANELVCVSRWASIDDWKSYWSDGVPEPEGELPKNEILVEIKTLARPARSPKKKSPAPKR